LAKKRQELSRHTLGHLEEEMRIYPRIPKLKAQALLTAEIKGFDENWWIKGTNKRSEPPLDELLKKERNRAYQYYDKLEKDIKKTVEGLAPELQKIVIECFWGENSYYDWSTIGLVYLGVGTAKIYEVRYKILEGFAKVRGVTF